MFDEVVSAPTYKLLSVLLLTLNSCNISLQPQVVEKHFLDLKNKYGNVLAVNLVNKVHFHMIQLICLWACNLAIVLFLPCLSIK